ncbi:uncharacterized protein LOC143908942 [Arctopsyche grandis]|uniref:uncharacterized protein LOC143908942 n=1 Tax=Arctopsyche grandis TaxID=121162 RepID=UPI00406D9E6D
MSSEQVKCSERSLKKQEILRPTSILPAISPSLKHHKSVDSAKSSNTSSRVSTASSKSSSKRTEKKEPNDNLNLIIFGSSALVKTNPQPDTIVKTKQSTGSKFSQIKEENPLNSEKNEDIDPNAFKSKLSKKTSRANSIPGPINRRYSIETSTIRQARHTQLLKKSELNKCGTDIESRSTECVFRENFSLDLSRMSDFADSEDETVECKRNSKQKLNKGQNNAMRRRRSIDKERILSSKTVSPRSIPKSLLTRRSSLQSVSSRGLSFTSSFDNALHGKVGSTYSIKDYGQQDSPTNTLRTLKNTESICSSPSPDYNTSEPSTGDTSPCKHSPKSQRTSTFDKKYSSMDSNRATISPMSQMPCLSSSSSCYTSWMEKSVDSELICSRNQEGENVSNGASAKDRGEWNNFWRNYNSSLATFPKQFYDDCPTPFYESNEKTLMPNYDINTKTIIEEEDTNTKNGDSHCVCLSRDEAKEMIHCARRLAEILTSALEKGDSYSKNEKLITNSKEVQVNVGIGTEHNKNETIDNVVNSNDIRENVPRKKTFNNHDESTKLDIVARMLLSGITTLSSDSKDVLL